MKRAILFCTLLLCLSPIMAIGAGITGKVLDVNGKPAKNARVELLELDSSDSPLRFYTFPDGTYRYYGLREAEFRLTFTDPTGAGLAQPVHVRTKEKKTTAVPPVTFIRTACIRGVVKDAETGTPLKNMLVNCTPAGQAKGARDYVWTEKDGAFNFRLFPGIFSLNVNSFIDDYPDSDRRTIQGKTGKITDVIFLLKKITANANTQPAKVTPPPPTKVTTPPPPTVAAVPPQDHIQPFNLTGTIIDEAGKPLSISLPVAITYTVSSHEHVNKKITSGADGHFTITDLSPGLLLFSTWSVPAAWKTVRPTQLQLPVKEPLIIVMRKCTPFTIDGRIVTPVGKPVDGVTLRAQIRKMKFDEKSCAYVASLDSASVTSDAGGRYQFHLEPTDSVDITAVEKERYQLRHFPVLPDSPHDVTLDAIVMSPLTGTLTGRVLDPAGKPVAGAQVVTCEDAMNKAVTDADGKFSLASLPEGPLHVMAISAAGLGEAKGNTGGTVTLKLRPSPSGAKPDPHDIGSILNEIERLLIKSPDTNFAREETVRYLVRTNPERAYQMMKRIGRLTDDMLADFIAQLTEIDSDRAAGWAPAHLAELKNPDTRRQAMVDLGSAVQKNHPELAEKLYQQARKLTAGNQQGAQYTYNCQMLRFAGRLKKAEASDYFKKAFAFLPSPLLAGAAAAVSPQLADQVLSSLTGSPNQLALVEVAREVQRYDPRAAARLLEKQLPEDATGNDRFRTVLVVIRALRAMDPVAALALAEKSSGYTRTSALTLAARYQPVTEAARIFRGAAEMPMLYGKAQSTTLAYLAAQTYTADKVAGAARFAEIYPLIQQREQYQSDGIAAYAYFSARIDPVLSRLLVEAEFAGMLEGLTNHIADAYSLRNLPLAIAPVDFKRAMAMAKIIAERYPQAGMAAYTRLLHYAIADQEERTTDFFRGQLW